MLCNVATVSIFVSFVPLVVEKLFSVVGIFFTVFLTLYATRAYGGVEMVSFFLFGIDIIKVFVYYIANIA